MTKDNDLVKRLRAVDHLSVEDCFLQSPLYGDAASRIEALTEQLEAARLDAKEAEAYSVWLERRLAKAVKVLVLCRDMFDEVAHPSDPMSVLLNTTLAELEGDKP